MMLLAVLAIACPVRIECPFSQMGQNAVGHCEMRDARGGSVAIERFPDSCLLDMTVTLLGT